jgi:TetR/AcrR family transcriptional regulator
MPKRPQSQNEVGNPRQRMTAEARRQQIIQVALDLFSKDGYGGTTTRSIAAAAGVSEAIIFRYFATKEELYTAILEHRAAQQGKDEWQSEINECAERLDDEGLFKLLISKVFEAYRADPNFHRLMLYASLEGHEIAKVSDERVGMPVYQFLCDYVIKRQRQGAFRKCEPGVVVFALVGMALQYATSTMLIGRDLLKSSDEEVASNFAGLLVNGIRKPADGGGRYAR